MYYTVREKELVSESQHTENIRGEINETNYPNL